VVQLSDAPGSSVMGIWFKTLKICAGSKAILQTYRVELGYNVMKRTEHLVSL
jgi:hypothetical protein